MLFNRRFLDAGSTNDGGGTPPGAGSTSQTDVVQLQAQYNDLKSKHEAALAESETWKGRFTGLQGTYQKEKEKWDAEAKKAQELSNTIALMNADGAKQKAALEALQAEFGTTKQELQKVSASHSRLSIISKEFPGLLSFETDGLLPGGDGEELRVKLKAFSQRLADTAKQDLSKQLGGGVPPQPGESGTMNAKQAFEAAKAAFAKGDMVEYERLYKIAIQG